MKKVFKAFLFATLTISVMLLLNACQTTTPDDTNTSFLGFDVDEVTTVEIGDYFVFSNLNVTDSDGQKISVAYSATVNGEPVTVISGKIVIESLQTHIAIYKISYKGKTYQKNTTINVVDTTMPLIRFDSLSGYAYFGSKYTMDDVTVIDNSRQNIDFTVSYYTNLSDIKVPLPDKTLIIPQQSQGISKIILVFTAQDSSNNIISSEHEIMLFSSPYFNDVDNFYSGNYAAAILVQVAEETSVEIVTAEDVTDEYADELQLAEIKSGINTSALKWEISNLRSRSSTYAYLLMDSANFADLSAYDYIDLKMYVSYDTDFNFPIYLNYKYGTAGSHVIQNYEINYNQPGWYTMRITRSMFSQSISDYHGIIITHWASGGKTLSANIYLDSIKGGYESEILLESLNDRVNILDKFNVEATEIVGAIYVSKDGGAYTEMSGYILQPEQPGEYNIKVTVNRAGYSQTELILSVKVMEKQYYPDNIYSVSNLFGETEEADLLEITGFAENDILGDIQVTYGDNTNTLTGSKIALLNTGLYKAVFTVRIDGYKDTIIIVNIVVAGLPKYTDVDNFYSGNYIASTTSPTSGQTSLQIVNADDITDEYASTEQLATIKNGIETSSLKWTIINLKRNADGYVFIKLDNSKLNRLSDFDYVDVRVYLSYNSSQFTFPLYIGYKYGESGSQYKVSADDKSFAGAGWHTVRITKDRLSLSINGYNGIYLSHWATAASGQELSANVYIDSITGGYQSELMLDTASDSLDLLSKLKVSAGEITGAIQVSKDGGAYTDISGYVFTPEEAGNYSIKVTVNKEGYAETEITLSVEVKEKPYYPNNEYTVSYILGEITEANILSITGFLESEILGDIMLTYDGINSQLIGFTVELSSAGLYVAEFTVRIDGYKDTNVIVNINLTELPGFTDIDNFDSGTYTAAVTSAVAGATSAQLINAENITDEYATPQQLDAIKDGINVSALKWTITNQKRNAEGYSFIRLDGTKMGATYDFDYVDVRMYISYNSGSFTAPLFIGFKHGESGSQYTVTPATSYSGTGWHTVRIPKATLQKSIAGYHGIYLTFYLNQTLSANVYVDSITGGYNDTELVINSTVSSISILEKLNITASEISGAMQVSKDGEAYTELSSYVFTPEYTGEYSLKFTVIKEGYSETEIIIKVIVSE